MNMRFALALATLILTGCVHSETHSRYSSADEALYQTRFVAQQRASTIGGGLRTYDPIETVEGASAAGNLSISYAPTIANDTLEKAITYARERSSSALLIWRGGEIESETYFTGFTQSSLINSKSLAKPLAAILVGRAIALGHIGSLDQPASDFIIEWKGDEQKEKITIRHLLGMRSGLLPQGIIQEGPEHVLNRAYLHPRHDEVIINDYPLTHEPGTRYEYSNANSELIAPIIERATGTRYPEFLSEELLKPLGAEGGTVWVNREGGTAHSGCCIQLPARTWLRLAVLLVNEGIWENEQLLPSGFVGDMRRTTPQNPHAGLSVWVAGEYVERRGSLHPSIDLGRTYHSEPYLADDLFLFDGNGNQVAYIMPKLQTVILRTGNFPGAEKTWDNAFLPNLIARDLLGQNAEERAVEAE